MIETTLRTHNRRGTSKPYIEYVRRLDFVQFVKRAPLWAVEEWVLRVGREPIGVAKLYERDAYWATEDYGGGGQGGFASKEEIALFFVEQIRNPEWRRLTRQAAFVSIQPSAPKRKIR